MFLKQVIDRITEFMAYLGGACFLMLSLYITFSALGRYTGAYFSESGDDVSAFVLAGASTWAMAYALRVNGHVRIDVVFSALPGRWRDAFATVSYALTGLFAGLLAVYGWRLAFSSLKLGTVSISMIQTPLYIPQAIVAFGFSMLTLEAILLTGVSFARQLSGRSDG